MSAPGLRSRSLFLLAFGAVLAALPLGTALRVLGTLLAAAGVWLLQPPVGKRSKQRFATATALVGAWALALLLDLTTLGQAFVLAAFLLAGGALSEIAELNAWSYATKAWRNATRMGAVVYGVSLLVGIAQVALGAGDLLTDSLLGPAGPGLLALPVVSVVRAAAHSARDQAQAQGSPVPRLASWASSASASALLVLVLLLPLWLLLALVYQHQGTPTFSAVAKHPATWEVPSFAPATLVDVTARPWSSEKPVGFRSPEDPRFPTGLQSAGHGIDLEIHHGGERLLQVKHQILATLDLNTGRLRGARSRTTTLETGRGFRVEVLVRIDLDAEPRDSARFAPVPFTLWVALLSGDGTPNTLTQRLRGIERRHDTIPGTAPSELPWWAPNLEGLAPLLTPASDPKAGLAYMLVVEGELKFGQGKGRPAARVGTRSRFRVSALEYDYSVKLDERVTLQDTNLRSDTPRRSAWTHRRRWRGRVW